MTADVLIVDAVRSPIGRAHGLLASLDSVALLTQTVTGLLARNDLDAAEIDHVILGEGGDSQVGGLTQPARLGNDIPLFPIAPVSRQSGSSQRALRFAIQGIRSGWYDLVVVAEVSTPDRPPLLDPTADAAAARLGLSRPDLDGYASRSHHRAAASTLAGDFGAEIVPVEIRAGGTRQRITTDDSIRAATTVEALAALEPMFSAERRCATWDHAPALITAGNSAHPASGASALLIANRRRARSLRLAPRARVVATSSTDRGSPISTGPILATEKILASGKIRLECLDHVEVDEMFAGLPLAWAASYGLHPDLINPRGGSIALGDPVAAASFRLLTTMLSALEATGGRYGLQTMYETADRASAVAIERL